jgi:hypothetical protein
MDTDLNFLRGTFSTAPSSPHVFDWWRRSASDVAAESVIGLADDRMTSSSLSCSIGTFSSDNT